MDNRADSFGVAADAIVIGDLATMQRALDEDPLCC